MLNVFLFAYLPYIYFFFGEVSVKILCPLKKHQIVSSVLGFESYLHILKTNPLSDMWLRSLSPSLWQILGLSYRVANWGTERLGNLPKITWYMVDKDRIQPREYFLCRHALGQVETKLDNQMTRSQSNTTPNWGSFRVTLEQPLGILSVALARGPAVFTRRTSLQNTYL